MSEKFAFMTFQEKIKSQIYALLCTLRNKVVNYVFEIMSEIKQDKRLSPTLIGCSMHNLSSPRKLINSFLQK